MPSHERHAWSMLVMTRWFAALVMLVSYSPLAQAADVDIDHEPPSKAVFDFFFSHPRHIGPALGWVRSYMNPLMAPPYDLAPEFLDIVVVIHGTEIVTLAQHNYDEYRDSVERMRYFASLGVKFRVCELAMSDYGYTRDNLYDFVEIASSAMIEVVRLQQQGYGLVVPQVHDKQFTIEEIR